MSTDLEHREPLVDQATETIKVYLPAFVDRLRDAGWLDPQEAGGVA